MTIRDHPRKSAFRLFPPDLAGQLEQLTTRMPRMAADATLELNGVVGAILLF
jgi:hypothetical protein